MKIVRTDHVQLAMPEGCEDEACSFYRGILGIPDVPKPPQLAGRGGVWFERGDLKMHLGVDEAFTPARKAHPAFVVADLPALTDRLKAAGVAARDDEAIPGYRRIFVDDPFGNRQELLEPDQC